MAISFLIASMDPARIMAAPKSPSSTPHIRRMRGLGFGSPPVGKGTQDESGTDNACYDEQKRLCNGRYSRQPRQWQTFKQREGDALHIAFSHRKQTACPLQSIEQTNPAKSTKPDHRKHCWANQHAQNKFANCATFGKPPKGYLRLAC